MTTTGEYTKGQQPTSGLCSCACTRGNALTPLQSAGDAFEHRLCYTCNNLARHCTRVHGPGDIVGECVPPNGTYAQAALTLNEWRERQTTQTDKQTYIRTNKRDILIYSIEAQTCRHWGEAGGKQNELSQVSSNLRLPRYMCVLPGRQGCVAVQRHAHTTGMSL